MNRISTVIWMLVIVVAAFFLYMAKYQVQSVKNQVVDTSRELEHEKEALHVAAAEWAYLNRPERLASLAQKYLASSDMTVGQVAEIEQIPFPRQQQAAADMSSEVKPVSASVRTQGGAGR